MVKFTTNFKKNRFLITILAFVLCIPFAIAAPTFEKSNISCAFASDNITLNVIIGNLTFPLSSATFIYTINNTQYEKPMVITGNKSFATILSSEFHASQDVTWNIFVQDTNGSNYTNGLKTFYTANDSYLTVNPSIPDGLAGWYITEPLFSINGDNTSIASYYKWESSVIFPYVNPFGLENISNLNLQTAGTLGLYVFSEFATCNESMRKRIFYVDLRSPIIKPTNPLNNSIVYGNATLNISFLLDDKFQSNSGINLSTLNVLLDNISVTPETNPTNGGIKVFVWFLTNLSYGNHTLSVSVSDIAGRNSSLLWSFSFLQPPDFSMTVLAPTDGNYPSKKIQFSILLNTTAQSIRAKVKNGNNNQDFLLCTNCMSYGFSSDRFKVLKEGSNNIAIEATDQYGTIKRENRIVFIDSIAPKIHKTNPRNNAVFNGTGFSLTFSEINLKNVTLHYSNQSISMNCTSGQNVFCSIDVNLSSYHGMQIPFQYNVSDSLRSALSPLQIITADTTPPMIIVHEPITNGTYGAQVPFNITSSEAVHLSFSEPLFITKREQSLCASCTSFGFIKEKIKRFNIGNHTILVTAIDKAGQKTTTEITFAVV